jgi:hypothetical protein
MLVALPRALRQNALQSGLWQWEKLCKVYGGLQGGSKAGETLQSLLAGRGVSRARQSD